MIDAIENNIKKTSKGHTYLIVTLDQMTTYLRGLGICECCDTPMLDGGNLISVIGKAYCNECFDVWNKDAEFKHEEIELESLKTIEWVAALTVDI